MKTFVIILFLTISYSFLLGQDFSETKKSAEQGDAMAQYNLGVMYSKSGVVKRFSTGINCTDKNNTEEKRRLLSIQSKLNKIVNDYFIKYH